MRISYFWRKFSQFLLCAYFVLLLCFINSIVKQLRIFSTITIKKIVNTEKYWEYYFELWRTRLSLKAFIFHLESTSKKLVKNFGEL